jgi:hypothetical protein
MDLYSADIDSTYEPMPDDMVYTPAPTVNNYMQDSTFVALIIGPIGSGKTLGSIQKWFLFAHLQEPDSSGWRRTRTVVVRNTSVELKDTTIKSFIEWFGDDLQMNWANLTAVYEDEIEKVKAEILFRALDKPQDMKKLLSLEITYAYLNELRELPPEALYNVTSRLGRYPSPTMGVGATCPCAWADTNAFDQEHWAYKLFIEDIPSNHKLFLQPPAILDDGSINPEAENLENLPAEYYGEFMKGKPQDWIDVMAKVKFIPLKTGKPVYPEYNDRLHCFDEKDVRPPDKTIGIICGGENGRTSAVVFGQVDSVGRLVVFDEITSDDVGSAEFGTYVKQKIQSEYAEYKHMIWLDPAAGSRGQVTDHTQLKVWKNLGLNCSLAPTNKPDIVVEAVKVKLNTLIHGVPALIISSKCKKLRKGLNGGYQYRRVNISGERYAEKPDKNEYSHVCNALEYLVNGMGAGRELMTSSKFKQIAQSGKQFSAGRKFKK